LKYVAKQRLIYTTFSSKDSCCTTCSISVDVG